MDKQQLLSEIKQKAQAGEITQAEVLAQFPQAADVVQSENHSRLAEIMYYIGGTIVFVGIVVLCYQNWDYFNSPLRILVTLGSCVAAFVVAALLHRYQNLQKVSQAFFLLAGLLAPIGLNVLARELGFDITSDALQSLIYLILTAGFFGSLWFFNRTILLFFGILFATCFFHFVINIIAGESLLMQNYAKLWEYRILAEGLVWMLLGRYFSQTMYKSLSGTLYGFGVLGFLGAAIFLGGWTPNQNIFWELVYPLLVFGIIFLSVYAKTKSFLVFGSIFLIAYILKLTGEYFQTGLGWPLALVIAGLAIIAVGYYAFRINKKYLSQAA